MRSKAAKASLDNRTWIWIKISNRENKAKKLAEQAGPQYVREVCLVGVNLQAIKISSF